MFLLLHKNTKHNHEDDLHVPRFHLSNFFCCCLASAACFSNNNDFLLSLAANEMPKNNYHNDGLNHGPMISLNLTVLISQTNDIWRYRPMIWWRFRHTVRSNTEFFMAWARACSSLRMRAQVARSFAHRYVNTNKNYSATVRSSCFKILEFFLYAWNVYTRVYALCCDRAFRLPMDCCSQSPGPLLELLVLAALQQLCIF